MDGSDGAHEDTTILVQIEEVKSGIRVLPFVTKQLSCDHKTELAYFQGLSQGP